MRALFILFMAGFLPGSALAASFDCGKARTPAERAICGDPQLSALDDQMAQAYRDALGRLGESAPILRTGQRNWLKELPAPEPGTGHASMKQAYGERIAALRETPAYPSPDQPAAGGKANLSAELRGYDLVLRLLRACPAGDPPDDFTTVPAQLLVRAKGEAAPQVINLPQIFCRSADVEIKDYNFDGHPDIAVTNDNVLGYGALGQHVLLYEATSRRFVFSAAFTDLVSAHSAVLDAKRKEIEVMNKSGCCYHHTTVYRVENDRPTPVRERVEDATAADTKGVKVTERTWTNGRWVEKTFYE